MKFDVIETERFYLRKLTPEVFDFVFSRYSDEDLCEFLALETESDFQREKNRYEKGLTMFNKTFLYFQIIDKLSEQILGWCGFHTWYFEHQRAELGYMLYDEHSKGRGIMSEVLKLIIEYGFKEMNLHRIEAFVGKENIPSLKLMTKFNFIQEGVLREHYKKNGVIEDSIVFGLLNLRHS